ncbi:hypothetical protein SAMN05660206_101397 [Sphingobacterium wenxiniae]|uniref:Uncharacterized protein n=1 Tax=Sphingobacterium wenxiniae TaxID=683125 RepID=A0A1I6PCM7_9SPHI|nr:hypothetical protein SAMN05660206_101397 [Sphingobacterium wenxiniae]
MIVMCGWTIFMLRCFVRMRVLQCRTQQCCAYCEKNEDMFEQMSHVNDGTNIVQMQLCCKLNITKLHL